MRSVLYGWSHESREESEGGKEDEDGEVEKGFKVSWIKLLVQLDLLVRRMFINVVVGWYRINHEY